MKNMKHAFALILVVLLVGSSVSAVMIQSTEWVNLSLEGGYTFQNDARKPGKLGVDLSYYDMLASKVGYYIRTGLLWGMGGNSSMNDLTIPVSAGVALSTPIAGGVSLYGGMGPLWTFQASGKNALKEDISRLGVQLDIGLRFTTSVGSGLTYLAIVAGIIGDYSFYQSINNRSYTFTSSGDIFGYVGCSLGMGSISTYGESYQTVVM